LDALLVQLLTYSKTVCSEPALLPKPGTRLGDDCQLVANPDDGLRPAKRSHTATTRSTIDHWHWLERPPCCTSLHWTDNTRFCI